jgi:hypothetical protein
MIHQDEIRLAWLSKQEGSALVSDDNGHWAVATTGTQNVPPGKDPCDISTQFWIKKAEWRNSIREAIDAAMEEDTD